LDATDREDFMEKLEMLKPKWEVVSPDFVEWFCKHEAEVICSTMIASVRTTAGLGCPPKAFTTNANESLNNLLKQKVGFKCSEWPKFHNTLQMITNERYAEFEKTIFGQGEYELVDESKFLEVLHSQ